MSDEKLFWDSGKYIHACERSQIHPGRWLAWTKCKRDVPAGELFRSEDAVVTCPGCQEIPK